jgi:hypothetical protein
MLPSAQQFLSANFHLLRAAEQALLTHWMSGVDRGTPEFHKVQCIQNFKSAAEALGFELVQRAAPPSPGGGRFDLEVDADV